MIAGTKGKIARLLPQPVLQTAFDLTPEDDPLMLFGGAATDSIRTLLDEHRCAAVSRAAPVTP